MDIKGVECDSLWLAKAIESLDWNIDAILELFSDIRGEFALILFNKSKNEIIFGRDRLGRRSLLISASNESFCLVSVGANGNLIELPADGIYHMNLNSDWSKIKRYNYPAETVVENHGNNELIFINNFDDSPLDVERVLSNASEFTITVDTIPYSKKLPEHWNFQQNVSDTSTNQREEIALVDKLLNEAVSRRIKYRKGNIGILFSGGLDCSLVVYYAAKNVSDVIYLFSVAFGKSEKDFEACPDRKTAESSYLELCQVCPTVKLELVRINIFKNELEDKRRNHIRYLINPRVSVLDDSIGSALWFASSFPVELERCSVLLSGLGADELFCGYSQHRRIHDREGIGALGADVQNMIERIAERNCGRDDRVISDSGREYRMPFLDLDFISAISKIPISKRCNLKLDRGVGEKSLLREVAKSKGLISISGLEKRAIQFGSRIAKMANGKQKGDFISRDLVS